MCRTLNKINEGFAPASGVAHSFSLYVCLVSGRPPAAVSWLDRRMMPFAPAAKIFSQSASACSAAAVSEKHISMMHADADAHAHAPQKQHQPGVSRPPKPTINWPTNSLSRAQKKKDTKKILECRLFILH